MARIPGEIIFGEVDGFISMLLAACEDRAMNDTLEMLLSQPDVARKAVVHRLLERLRGQQAPAELIDAIACLLDDEAGEQAYRVIFQCGRKLK